MGCAAETIEEQMVGRAHPTKIDFWGTVAEVIKESKKPETLMPQDGRVAALLAMTG